MDHGVHRVPNGGRAMDDYGVNHVQPPFYRGDGEITATDHRVRRVQPTRMTINRDAVV